MNARFSIKLAAILGIIVVESLVCQSLAAGTRGHRVSVLTSDQEGDKKLGVGGIGGNFRWIALPDDILERGEFETHLTVVCRSGQIIVFDWDLNELRREHHPTTISGILAISSKNLLLLECLTVGLQNEIKVELEVIHSGTTQTTHLDKKVLDRGGRMIRNGDRVWIVARDSAQCYDLTSKELFSAKVQ
jgi:hypothetical protein